MQTLEPLTCQRIISFSALRSGHELKWSMTVTRQKRCPNCRIREIRTDYLAESEGELIWLRGEAQNLK